MRRVTLLALASLTIQSGCSSPSAAYTPLFNGEDLTGWYRVLDSKWYVADGVVYSIQKPTGRLSGESWLFTEGNYRDFILRLKYRITPGGNSGVFVRDPVDRTSKIKAHERGPVPWESGYEVNINNDHETYPTGAIWALASGTPGLQFEEDWNVLKIKVRGRRIWTWVNGHIAVDGAELPPRSKAGAIGLQRHGGKEYRDKLIEFKDIEIREI